jgi:uncharacterized caspase-like protein
MSRAILGWFALLFLLAAAIEPADAQAAAEKRVAFVIGIGDYRDPLLGKLDHPKGDAEALAQKLGELGFKVVKVLDRTKQQLRADLDAFVKSYRGADAVLVYVTGHGLQIGGENFVLPTDANFDTAVTLRKSALALNEIVGHAAQVAPSRIILLDACRDDPTARTLPQDPAVPIASGLARIGRADGTIFAFSTAPGATAEDGSGDHSPFAQALLTHLGDKGLEFGSVMKLVQMEVYDRTPEHQLPYIEDALPTLFFTGTQTGPLPERDRLLLAMAKIDADTRAQVERIANARKVPLAPLYGSLVGGTALSDKDAESREKLLTQVADDFIKVRADLKTLASSDPEVTQLRSQAEYNLSLGAIEAARSALTRAIEVDQASGDTLEARLKVRKLSQAASYAARAGVARTVVKYRAAASDFATAAILAERWDAGLAWRYTLDQANNLDTLGEEFGDNAALTEAIDIYRKALALAPRERRPLDWAATQDGLGVALRSLGERQPTSVQLEQAIAAFHEALQERTRERVPLDWASTEFHLGVAFLRLAFRESGTKSLEAAAATFQEALKEWTHERDPLNWARTQNALGNAFLRLGQRDSGTARLEEAVAAYRQALKELTRERVPLGWASTLNNLGIALTWLGMRESGTARLEEAVGVYYEALKVSTRERVPMQWAMLHDNLGRALTQLGVREAMSARLEEAATAFREALKERTRERMPLDWARTKLELGNALRTIGERESGTARLEEAIAATREALTELTRERAPLDWSSAQNDLGNALERLGERESGTARFEEAVSAYREALKEETRERVPLRWANLQDNLGNALRMIGQRENGAVHLEEAVSAYRESLKENTRERAPFNWASAELNLGDALKLLGERESEKTRLEQAVAAYGEALKEYHRERVPLLWAMATGSQGITLCLLAQKSGDAAAAQKAVRQIELALETIRAGGNAVSAAYYTAQITKAQAAFDRLNKR